MRFPASRAGPVSVAASRVSCGRIPVWVLKQARRLGTSEAELLSIYPTLRAEDIVHTWAYVRAHRDEIEQQIHDNEDEFGIHS